LRDQQLSDHHSLKTQSVCQWLCLNSSLRDQQLIDHHSRLKSKCQWLELGLTFDKSAATGWHRQLIGTFLPIVGGAIKQLPWHWDGPVPVRAKTTLWLSRVTLVNHFCSLASLAHLSRKSHQIACSWRPGCNLYHLIQMRHDQSSINKIQKCVLDSCRVFGGWRTNTSHLSRKGHQIACS